MYALQQVYSSGTLDRSQAEFNAEQDDIFSFRVIGAAEGTHPSNREYIVEEIHDILKSCYKVTWTH